MSFDTHLIHTCTIKPPATGSANVYNNPSKAFGTPVTGVRCRLVETREKVLSDERQQSVIRSMYMLLVNASVTLSERAEVSLVTLEDGTALTDTFVVTEVLWRHGRNRHHKTAMLERIS